MIPQLAEKLVTTYVPEKENVSDPFCGGVAVLVECVRNRRQAYGTDVNPLAILIAKVKSTHVDKKPLEDACRYLQLSSERSVDGSTFFPTKQWALHVTFFFCLERFPRENSTEIWTILKDSYTKNIRLSSYIDSRRKCVYRREAPKNKMNRRGERTMTVMCHRSVMTVGNGGLLSLLLPILEQFSGSHPVPACMMQRLEEDLFCSIVRLGYPQYTNHCRKVQVMTVGVDISKNTFDAAMYLGPEPVDRTGEPEFRLKQYANTERIRADVPASRMLMSKGLLSLTVTLDARGELGTEARPYVKRQTINRGGSDACFSFNRETADGGRIKVVDPRNKTIKGNELIRTILGKWSQVIQTEAQV